MLAAEKQCVENDLLLPEGVCFGWFSNVNMKCQPVSCLQSARCQMYTVTLQQTSGMLDLTTKPTISTEKAKEKSGDDHEKKEEAQPHNETTTPEDVMHRAFFDHVINVMTQHMEHDDVHHDPLHIWATLKFNRCVKAFVIRNRKCVRVRLGGAKDAGRPELEIEMGTEPSVMDQRLISFLKKHTN